MGTYVYLTTIILFCFPFSLSAHVGDQKDCSAAYYETSRQVTCEVITCSPDYQTFLGSWEGPFHTVHQATGKKWAYRNQVTYSSDDCLKNIDQTHSGFGDVFIIGRQTDIFPPLVENGKTLAQDKIELGLLITGRSADGKPFLRTINGSDKRNDYTLVKKDEKSVTSIWSLFRHKGYCDESGKCYDIKVTTFDGRDMAYKAGHKRNVKISLEAFEPGTQNKVYEETDLVSGFHILRK